MLGELYGFVKGGFLDFDCLAPLEHFVTKTPIVKTQYIIRDPSLDLIDGSILSHFPANYQTNLYYEPSMTVTGTIPSFLAITNS
jgi:hypothetical protein